MTEEKPEPQDNLASPENGAEPDYTGLEAYVIYPPYPDRPPRWEAPGVTPVPQEPGKLSVEESLQRLKQLPPLPETDWDSTEVIRRMRGPIEWFNPPTHTVRRAMAEEKQELQENLATPENGAEPDYTGLEQYIVPAPHPNSPLNRALRELEQRPVETEKLSVDEFLKLVAEIPPTDDDSTAMIRRMRDA